MRQMEQPVGGANSFFYAHHTSLSAPSFPLLLEGLGRGDLKTR